MVARCMLVPDVVLQLNVLEIVEQINSAADNCCIC